MPVERGGAKWSSGGERKKTERETRGKRGTVRGRTKTRRCLKTRLVLGAVCSGRRGGRRGRPRTPKTSLWLRSAATESPPLRSRP